MAIFIIEGADGTGKTTLAQEILEQTKGHLLHSSFKKKWNIYNYHKLMMKVARELNTYQDVVLDRWAPSEFVYGTVFREKPSYDVVDLMWESYLDPKIIKFIYCRNDNAVENHLKNKRQRIEMFEDMNQVVELFDQFVKDTSDMIDWIEYDFNKVDVKEFVKEITNVRD